MVVSVFYIVCKLKTLNPAFFSLYFRLHASYDKKYGNNLEETYESYYVTMNRGGDPTIM